jgi:hypothetical protein
MTNHKSKDKISNNEKAEIISKAVCRVADFWKITNQQLSKILGLSGSSISRLRNKQFFISEDRGKEWELALLFIRAYRGLDAYMGGHKENEIAWLSAQNTALGGKPIELMQNIQGLTYIVQYIDCVRGR